MKTLLSKSGELRFGKYSEPVGSINFQDYPLRDGFRKRLSPSEINRQFVHFHFMGFTCPQFIAGCSMTLNQDHKTAFFYLFDRLSKETHKFGFRISDATDGQISLNPDNGQTELSKENAKVLIECDEPTLTKKLEVSSPDGIDLSLKFSETECRFDTLRLCTPTGANGWTYCQKVAGIVARGHLTYKGKTYDLEKLSATAHHDFTAGFLRRDTFWNWACVTEQLEDGTLIGINVSNGVNETGASENIVWINGKSEKLGLFLFSYDQDDLSKSWEITCDRGSAVRFTSEGMYEAFNNKIQTGFDFSQLFGTFSGTLITRTGTKIELNNLSGFCERQYSIWY
ncbi:DUF2804 domain-containing protein [Sneathiella glossodoripedis]|uniref:DUF2804 domain-containing protein n=1 Tax=Sneathiella glossodoripedis TaxID=418853 RepID=UPI00046E6F05|nr:DUF2804 domain-containing protein [Sneathiella glossodoripedis]